MKSIHIVPRRQSLGDLIITGLDIGTHKTCAAIGEYNENGILEITGVGIAASTGLRKGVIVNIEAAMQSVSKAIEAAELMSGREVKDCFVGIAGANIMGINSRGVVAVTGRGVSRGREIDQNDIERVLEAAKAVVIPMDREVLHVIPQSFIVDDQRGIRNPLDMIGVRLEAEVHIVTGSVTSAQNLARCVNRAGFKVNSLILQSLAASRAVLNADEKELGCLLVDLGAGTTDVFMYSDTAPYYSDSVAVGGVQVTNDLSVFLNIPMDAAEKIKLSGASCYAAHVDDSDTVIIPGIAGRAPQEVSSKRIALVLQARMMEIFDLIKDKISAQNFWPLIKGGIVLTGGGALLPGAADLASEVFKLPARVAMPSSFGGIVDAYRSPQYSTVIGLVLLGAESVSNVSEYNRSQAFSNKSNRGEAKHDGILKKGMNWLKEFF